MKRSYIYIIGIACSFAALFSCTRFDEQDIQNAPESADKVKTEIVAVTEGGSETKTVLDGAQGDPFRQILWQPGDSIRVFSTWDYYGTALVNIETTETTRAVFSGEVSLSNLFYGLYACNGYQYDSYSGILHFKHLNVQKYKEDSFNTNAMPMATKAASGQEMYFYCLAGVLSINLTGSQTIQSVSFTGYDEYGREIPVAGDFLVDLNTSDYPIMQANSGYTQSKTVSLDCGEGVKLEEGSAKSFYLVLPVGTYSSFKITIMTTDGKFMVKEGTNPLTIKRANVTKAGTLEFVEEVSFDLSEHGLANCYIVKEPGFYTFDANIIGNGDLGLVQYADFHTTDVWIEPASADIIWDKSCSISTILFGGNKIGFYANENKGNALIAAKDAKGNILWSWHIWSTDQPEELVYINGSDTYTMLDRNLGAIRADRGGNEQWIDAIGLYYQWGRKDPFGLSSDSQNLFSTNYSRGSLMESINNPSTFYGTGYSRWNATVNNSLWSGTQKTIYDPCPVGYRVSHTYVWDLFTSDSVTNDFNVGVDFNYDGINTTYYPSTSRITDSGYFDTGLYDYCYYWSAESYSDNNSYSFNFDIYNTFNTRAHSTKSSAHAVRCMKDDGHVDRVVPVVAMKNVSDITSSGVTVNATITREGAAAVTEYGVVYGTQPGVTLENGTVISLEADGTTDLTVVIDGLDHSTRYYVKAYAKNELGVGYSKEQSFFTPFSGTVYNLSLKGTANSYIVPPVYGRYSFETVKGNSTESVGDVADAELLWQMRSPLDTTSIITSVRYADGVVEFELSETVEYGNALIAVKDANGDILWSWHIWVCDFDPEYTSEAYSNGAVMMDRNLGATYNKYSEIDNLYKRAEGLCYQWGRKDPFAEGLYTSRDQISDISEVAKTPTEIVTTYPWISGGMENLWSVDEKTIYDPCPAGWKVPEYEAMACIVSHNNYSSGRIVKYRGENETYFPHSRYIDSGNMYSPTWYSYYWTNQTSNEKESTALVLGDSIYYSSLFNNTALAIRCTKDEIFGHPSIETVNILATEIEIKAEVDIKDYTELADRGFVWTSNNYPTEGLTIYNGTVLSVGSGDGEYSVRMTDLESNTNYFIRAYAKGDKVIRYSPMIEVKTLRAGYGDEYTEDDYEW